MGESLKPTKVPLQKQWHIDISDKSLLRGVSILESVNTSKVVTLINHKLQHDPDLNPNKSSLHVKNVTNNSRTPTDAYTSSQQHKRANKHISQ